VTPGKTNAAVLAWDERLEVEVLRREVEALLRPARTEGPHTAP
jgi:hypothetical protein